MDAQMHPNEDRNLISDRAPTGRTLEWLLAEGSSGEFARNYYLRRPFSSAGTFQQPELASWETVGRLLSNPGADVIVGRGGEAVAERPQSLDDLRVLMDRGLTVGIRHAQDLDSAMRKAADEFHLAFGGAVDIHVYCTPAEHPGFGWHYDAEEVFVLQTVGTKIWRLRKNTVNPWPLMEAIPKDQRYGREISAVMETELRSGDWLYVPSGFWHATTSSEDSISLSVGIRPTTAMDILDSLRRSLSNSMLWRQRLPFQGSLAMPEAEREAFLKDLLPALSRDLAEHLSGQAIVESFVRTNPK